MFKRVFAVTLMGLAVVAHTAFASPDRTGKIDMGVNVSSAFSTDSEVNTAAYVGGNIAYGVNKYFAVGFEGGWQRHEIDDVTDSGITIFGPKLSGVPLFGDLIFRMPIENQNIVPYGLVGLGTVLWSIDDTSATGGVLVNTKVSDAFAVKLGGGFDWFLNDNWIINFDASYVFDRARETQTASLGGLSVSASQNAKLDYWNVGGGIKYLFS